LNILAVDTSAKVTSVSVIDETRVLAEFNIDTRLTHSQSLMPMIKSVLECAKIDIDGIDGYAVASGPGSFTGLRIGIGAIKGMAYASSKPCVAVSSLHSLAFNMIGVDGIVCAVMDARCNQVYTATFSSDGNKLTRLCDDMPIKIEELLQTLKQYEKNIFFVGDGADLCYNKSIDILENVFIADSVKKYQKASSVGYIALEKFLSANTVSASQLMPTYLRLPQAERELILKRKEGNLNEQAK